MGAACLLLIAACSALGTSWKQESRKREPPLTNARPSSALDSKVLEVALLDMPRPEDEADIYVSPVTSTIRQDVDQVLYQHEKSKWEKLSAAEIKSVNEAAIHLVRRIKVRDLVDRFRPRSKRIVIEEESEGMVVRRIRFWPPGYSRDTKTAVVRLIYPWSIHHGEATYVLFERNGKWEIGLRQHVVYP
jgi:hypothetical protein